MTPTSAPFLVVPHRTPKLREILSRRDSYLPSELFALLPHHNDRGQFESVELHACLLP